MKDRGSILPLVAGLFALCGVFVVAVIGSTDLAITRTHLQSVADGAALAASQTVGPGNGRLVRGRLIVMLTNSDVSASARRFIADSQTPGVRLRSATAADRRTAVVTVSTIWRAPFDSEFLPVRVSLTATARARTIYD